jgi:hypothetical protein
MTQEAWKTLNTTLIRLLPALANILFEKLGKNTAERVNLFTKKVRNIFGFDCHYTLFIIFFASLKIFK